KAPGRGRNWPVSTRCGTALPRSAGTSRTPPRSPERCAPCCRTGCPARRRRWSTSTAASMPRSADVPAVRQDPGAVGRGAQAIVLASFGGPEGPDEVLPFLRNVTRGRDVPEERLQAVAEHYLHFGGVSPINECNRELVRSLERHLRTAGIDIPVYFGNRNWHPLLEDTVRAMADDRVEHALVFATSAWGGYSGCRQYQ